MKSYRIQINDKEYLVRVEEVDANTVPAPTPAAAPAPAPAPAPATTGGEAFPAPIQGTILRLNCKAGDSVKKGQCLLILEAMKLENEIVAPKDAVIGEILVQPSQNVDAGQTLLTFR